MEKSKVYFGIFQDGYEIKVAALLEENDRLHLTKLYKKNLPVKSEHSDTFKGFESKMTDEFSFDGEDSSGSFGLDKNNPTSEYETVSGKFGTDAPSNASSVLGVIAQEMGFTSGSIAINLDVSNVTYKKMDKPQNANKKKIISKISGDFYEKGTTNQVAYSYFDHDDDSIIAIGHEGRMELLESLVSVSQYMIKRKFSFSLIQPNEIALMNAVRFNYDMSGNQTTAIIYIGLDYSRITLMKGNDFFMELPIINEGYGSEDIIKTVYSRFMLERSHHDIPSLDNIFIAGDGIDSETVDFIKERELVANVELLLPTNLFDDTEYTERYRNEELAEFIIPIMMAASMKFSKDERLYQVNFMPKQLLESQNIFTIGLPGFVVLGLILGVSLWSINNFFSKSNIIRKLKSDNKNIENQITTNETIIDSIRKMEDEIARLKTSIQRAETFIGNKNQSHYIYEILAKNFARYPLTWSKSILTDGNKIDLNATTTQRRHIPHIARLFPDGKIGTISETEVEGFTAWDFTISYQLPDKLETKRIDFRREGLQYVPRNKTYNAYDLTLEKEEDENAEATEQIKNSSSNIDDNTITVTLEKDDEVGKPELYKEALNLYRKGEYSAAINLFEKYTKNYKDIWVEHSYYFMAECYYLKGDYEIAKKKFIEILDKGKVKKPDTMIMLGNTYYKLGEKDNARIYWQRLIDEYPDNEYADKAKQKIDNLIDQQYKD